MFPTVNCLHIQCFIPFLHCLFCPAALKISPLQNKLRRSNFYLKGKIIIQLLIWTIIHKSQMIYVNMRKILGKLSSNKTDVFEVVICRNTGAEL